MGSKTEIKHLLISRTDSIGDVVLTLPMAGALKQLHPQMKISFLGRDYTRDVIGLSKYVDEFLSFDELSGKSKEQQVNLIREKKIDCVIHVFPKKEIAVLFKKAGVPMRIGTKNRLYHWMNCNLLIKLSRKNSDLHESQLNLKLIKSLGGKDEYSLEEIKSFYGFENQIQLDDKFKSLLGSKKENVILHPRSKGSAREWGLENFDQLIKQFPKDKYRIFISGTQEEGAQIKILVQNNPDVIDITGQMNLRQFIAFINAADGLIAASTGPLHIASALGKKALGLFAPMRPIHPGRWMPVGTRASYLVLNKNCNDCRKTQDCVCIRSITAAEVIKRYASL